MHGHVNKTRLRIIGAGLYPNSKPKTRNPESRIPNPETRNTKHESRNPEARNPKAQVGFFFTLVTGPRRSLRLKLSDTKSL